MATNQQPEQGPGGEAVGSGAEEATPLQEMTVNDKRATIDGESTRLAAEQKPLKRKSRTRQQDETSLQGSRRRNPSRACETLGAEHRLVREASRKVDSLSWRREGEPVTPGEEFGACGQRTGRAEHFGEEAKLARG